MPLVGSQAAQAITTAHCQLLPAAAREKENLRKVALEGDKKAEQQYQIMVKQHASQLRACRRRNWPQNQAIWLRLYPCDVQPGALDFLMDRIVNLGYNQVYVEAFYDGQVLLPMADNRTPWPSIVRSPGTERIDLLAEAIKKGRSRGLKVYAWMFTMNFGYTYSQLPDREVALARNGDNHTSVSIHDKAQQNTGYNLRQGDSEQVFIDPYNPQAKRDYYNMLHAVLQRQPDGVLFDYVRYPRLMGKASIASRVQDLWIYGQASRQNLYRRALNQKGRELIHRFLEQGFITVPDIREVDKLYPEEGEPLWQGRKLDNIYPAEQTESEKPQEDETVDETESDEQVKARQAQLQVELWQLTVAHAVQGILDFVKMASYAAESKGIPTGVVFFPSANKAIGQGFDSRLQPWDRFESSMEWHPMSYGVCGDASCIVSEVKRVLSLAPDNAQIQPVLAGNWGRALRNRPSLEVQMQAIRQVAPQIRTISHFAYSWQEPEIDRKRMICDRR
ncbi:MAG: family 10 glycosylhydrolase [Hormoscilla sp.]